MCGALIVIVSRAAKVLVRVLDPAAEQGIRFADMTYLLGRLQFTPRVRGSHNIFLRAGIVELLNLQPRSDGTAKPYQVRQVRRLILKYGLHMTLVSGGNDDE